MRVAVLSLLLALGCEAGKRPAEQRASAGVTRQPARGAPKPTAQAIEGRPIRDQCKALAPRLEPCLNEVIVASMAQLDPELSDVVAEELESNDRRRRTPETEGPQESMDVCKVLLVEDPDYANRVLRCWEETSCTSFIACIQSARLDAK